MRIEIKRCASKQKQRKGEKNRGQINDSIVPCIPCLLNSLKRLRLVIDGPVKMMVFLPEIFWHSCLATRLWSWGLFFKVARPSVPCPSFRWTEICRVGETRQDIYIKRIQNQQISLHFSFQAPSWSVLKWPCGMSLWHFFFTWYISHLCGH